MIDAQSALIYAMVLVSAADRDMTDAELQSIGRIVKTLPVFKGYKVAALTDTARACAELLNKDDGLDQTIGLIRDGLPARLRETAYALACEIAAADGRASQEELRLLELLRHGLDVERLEAAAIERGARARYRTA